MKKILSYLALVTFVSPLFASAHPPGYAVASASAQASNAGMAILAKGGNAFDAAVAVASTLAVTEPYSSGLGGGGFFLLHDQKHHKDVFLDAREVAPKAATSDMFLDKDGVPQSRLSLFSPLAAAIPGLPAGLDYLAKHYGKLPLTETMAAAIGYAENGFEINENYRDATLNPRVGPYLLKYPSTFKVLMGGQKRVEVGQRIVQKDLAATLREIAAHGRDGFYKGPVAKELVEQVRKVGGIWQLVDLESYQVKIRKPLHTHYRNMKITTAPPPSAGGITIVTMFDLLRRMDYQSAGDLQRIHFVLEAMRLAYWDRVRFMGDPDFVDIPIQTLTSKKHIDALAKFIKPDSATPSHSLPVPSVVFEDSGPNTTHFSIIDEHGNRVAATLSINFHFGAGFIVPGTGVLLNNEMDDFASKPGNQNGFGLVGGNGNVIAPGKRPVSSMSPTFIETPNQVVALGSTGGSRIPTAVFLASLACYHEKTPMTFVSEARYHHQYLPDDVIFEDDAFDATQQKGLEAMGYHLAPVRTSYGALSLFYGNMQAVSWLKKQNMLVAVSDPRYSGLAEVSEPLVVQ